MAKDLYIVACSMVVAFFLILGLSAMCPLAQAAGQSSSKKSKAKLTHVDSTDWCSACPIIIAELAKNNVETVEVVVTHAQSDYYPKCHYSDGTSDSGTKDYKKACNFASPVIIVKHKDKQ
jgi:hypothetical protein